MKNIILLPLVCFVFLCGCSQRPDIDQLAQRFFQYQTEFNQLAEISCDIKFELNTKFLNYKINTSADYPSSVSSKFSQVDALLVMIDSDHIVLSEDDCSLFIESWSFWLSGSGSYMGYSYHPPKLTEFNSVIHLEENRNYREEIHFTKLLADGWYIEYVNIP